jgi:RNA polymerase-binding transcription factor DksA
MSGSVGGEMADTYLQLLEKCIELERKLAERDLQLDDERAEHFLDRALLDSYEEDNRRLREGLRKLEWISDLENDAPSYGFCAACGNERSEMHKSDCWLAKLLEEEVK